MKWAGMALLVFIFGCSHSPQPLGTPSETQGQSIMRAGTPTVAWWQPAVGSSWQIQFSGQEIDTSVDAEIYDLDLFETPASLVTALHAQGKHVICYLNAGAWEDWRADAADFPSEVIGHDYEGWPGERWLDIGNLKALAPIMEARMDLCAAKGFDGVDPDNLDGVYNETGFGITKDEAIDYAQWLANEAHKRGLAIGLKNVPELATQLEPYLDWALAESCFAQGWCDQFSSFVENNKPVFATECVEEGMQVQDFCDQATELGFSALLKKRELDAWVDLCP